MVQASLPKVYKLGKWYVVRHISTLITNCFLKDFIPFIFLQINYKPTNSDMYFFHLYDLNMMFSQSQISLPQFVLTTFLLFKHKQNMEGKTCFLITLAYYFILEETRQGFCGFCIILQTSRCHLKKFGKTFSGLFLWCCVIQASVITLLDKKRN